MYTCVSSYLGLSVLREQFSECNLFFILIFLYEFLWNASIRRKLTELIFLLTILGFKRFSFQNRYILNIITITIKCHYTCRVYLTKNGLNTSEVK